MVTSREMNALMASQHPVSLQMACVHLHTMLAFLLWRGDQLSVMLGSLHLHLSIKMGKKRESNRELHSFQLIYRQCKHDAYLGDEGI